MLASLSVFAFADTPDGTRNAVYRGEKWEFDLGVPEKENGIILPQDREQPKVYGNGYVERVEKPEKAYDIILLQK